MSKKTKPVRVGAKTADVRDIRDVLSDASDRLHKARSLVDVLSEVSAPGGDLKAGAIALESLNPDSLTSTLCMLNEILIAAENFVEEAFPARAGVANV